MIFNGLQGLTIPEGVVTQIARDGVVLWAIKSEEPTLPIILEVEKITSNTYAGGTTYNNEEFILLDIYPKTNGTVNVTYGGLTKTITDTSGAEEPNAQQVFFGTFNGVSDSVTTPASGELIIEGDCYAFGVGRFAIASKDTGRGCTCICSVVNFGKVDRIPLQSFGGLLPVLPSKFRQTSMKIPSTIKSIETYAFYKCTSLVDVEISEGVESLGIYCFGLCSNLTSITIPSSVTFIGEYSFAESVKTVKMLNLTPPEMGVTTSDSGQNGAFGNISVENFVLEQIIVPKGSGNTYKTAAGWSIYADYIVEES